MPDPDGRTLLRTMVIPRNPQTAAQIQMQAYLTTVAEAMQTVSQPQVEAWQAIAAGIVKSGRLGLDYTLSWSQLFSEVNNYRLQSGAPITLDPDPYISSPPPQFVSVDSDDGSPTQFVNFHVNETGGGLTGYVVIRITRDMGSTSRQARKNELRYPADPSACIMARLVAVGPHNYQIETDRLNVTSGTHIGVEIMALSSNFYPSARLFTTNALVSLTP